MHVFCIWVCAGDCRYLQSQKSWDPLELQLQAGGSHPTWGLEIELGCFAWVARALNHQVTLAPRAASVKWHRKTCHLWVVPFPVWDPGLCAHGGRQRSRCKHSWLFASWQQMQQAQLPPVVAAVIPLLRRTTLCTASQTNIFLLKLFSLGYFIIATEKRLKPMQMYKQA